ncbi:hypothetical protein EST38_g11034 [Candolleomyces aberdarensis]|uniref:Protein kinase domain-containing protein n=1 Tax=Candolleomyces aberdarensis TaxID=2316362 RepID=A0A4Q2D5W4_9AGAR|nr:hypothetical protein EST38_g11034 [Candolleomyces aberdarensis]
MEGLKRSLLMADNLYADYALKPPFRLVRTVRPGRACSFISYGEVQEQGKWRPVVLKTYHKINDTTVTRAAQRTYREVQVLAALQSSPDRCENINDFLGVLFADSTLVKEAVPGIPSIITDFVQHDSLEYTQGRGFGVRLKIVQQLANGLSHMHSLGLVHGDLKPDNFRVTDDGVVKIIDFGLSRYQTPEHTGLTTLILPCYRFIAPELILPEMDSVSMFVTRASDVYAFSMTALQVLDGQGYHKSIPFNHCKVPFAVRLAVVQNQWPQMQNYAGVIPEVWAIISACWTSNASIRPSIDALLKDLSGIPLPM